MNAEVTLTLFTPGEAERITGLSTTMQRDWRHRGILPKNEGHARFDVFGLATMLALKLFADRGIGPQVAHKIVDIVAQALAWHALSLPDMFEGDLMWNGDADPALSPQDMINRHRRQVWRSRNLPNLMPARFLVLWADGSEWWDNSLDHAIQRNSTSDKLSGPIIVLDQESLGDLLADRVGRPLVHIEDHTNRPS